MWCAPSATTSLVRNLQLNLKKETVHHEDRYEAVRIGRPESDRCNLGTRAIDRGDQGNRTIHQNRWRDLPGGRGSAAQDPAGARRLQLDHHRRFEGSERRLQEAAERPKG